MDKPHSYGPQNHRFAFLSVSEGLDLHDNSCRTKAAAPDHPNLLPLESLLSSSAPATAAVWPLEIGEGSLALPNQAILPEDSRCTTAVPKVTLLILKPSQSLP